MTIDIAAARPRSVAPLKNVSALVTLVTTLQARGRGLPGLGVGSSPSGYGKTIAAQYCQNELGCRYVEYRSFWTAKTFCEMLLAELGNQRPHGTLSKMMVEIGERMGDTPDRILIIDEADQLVDRGNIELVRDIYETTSVPVILIGEELLPQKLEAFERGRDRVLDWVLVQRCDLDDTRALAALVCRGMTLADDLLDAVRRDGEGRARRIVVSLNSIKTFGQTNNLSQLDLKSYGGAIFTGAAPRRTRGV